MLKRLLLLLPLLAASAPSAAAIDQKTAEFCMKATDFAGCVETMQRGLPPKQQQDANDGMRTWTRATGVVVRMRTASVTAMKSNSGEYGRHIKWVYGRTGSNTSTMAGWQKEVQADCVDQTADWNQDAAGWIDVSDPEKYRRDTFNYEPVIEARSVMDEFCPQMDRLVEEAKERDRLNPPVEKKKKSSIQTSGRSRD